MSKENETPENETPATKGRPSKLNDDQVINIRERYNFEKKEALAEEFGISTAYLYKVATGAAAKGVDFALVPKPAKEEAPAESEAE